MAFKAHFLNVGLAGCTIFEMDNDLVMIDCGYRRTGTGVSKPTDILNYLNKTIGKTYIDLMIISHPHHDHYLGIEDLVGKATVAKLWGSPYERRRGDNSLAADEWNEYSKLIEKLVPDASKRFTATKGATEKYSGCTFQILGPRKDVNSSDTRECHDASLVVWVGAPANNFIVCGDASDSELDLVRADWKLADCHVLKASHHGSINGANLDFIKAVEPRDTIISTKSGIIDNIPHSTALQRYKDHSTNVFRTDVSGTCTTPLKKTS